MRQICVTVSGGETSAYNAILMRKHYANDDLVYIFANTGWEREETLEFLHMLETDYSLPIVWVEAFIHHGVRKGSTHKIVNFETASRNGEPFQEMCKEYGLPNKNCMHCTRELKENPIKSYLRSLGWKKWHTAIGIRCDELDRVSPDYKKKRKIYPMAFDWPTTKPDVSWFWHNQPKRLNLKEHEGNCKGCYKKSDRKHARLIKEDMEIYKFTMSLESDYGHIKPKEGEVRRNMFRHDLSTKDYIKHCSTLPPWNRDNSTEYGSEDMFGCQEHCEPFSK